MPKMELSCYMPTSRVDYADVEDKVQEALAVFLDELGDSAGVKEFRYNPYDPNNRCDDVDYVLQINYGQNAHRSKPMAKAEGIILQTKLIKILRTPNVSVRLKPEENAIFIR